MDVDEGCLTDETIRIRRGWTPTRIRDFEDERESFAELIEPSPCDCADPCDPERLADDKSGLFPHFPVQGRLEILSGLDDASGQAPALSFVGGILLADE